MDSEDIYFTMQEAKHKYYQELFLRCFELLGEKATVEDACTLARQSISVALAECGVPLTEIESSVDGVKKLILG